MVTIADHGQPTRSERLALVDERIRRAGRAQDELIEILHVVQDTFGYLPEDVLLHIAHELRLPPAHVHGVATFYHLFEIEPPGEHCCTVCVGTACFVEGAAEIVSELSERFEVTAGGTSPGGRLTLRTARCLGSCGLAPLVVLDGAALAHQRPDTALEALSAAVDTGSPSG